ncbi:hypothetical protein C0J52_08594 [Blattella germanica]|nr:hypothetical protein C0J52_08594 [Blattella germanica]
MGQEDAENANITVTDESTKHSKEQSVQDVHQQLKPQVLEPSQEGIFTKPRDTIDVDGPYYEVKFALMLFVRGICKLYGIEKFKLAANVGETNPFDDAVFQCFFRTPDETLTSRTYFIQLKHKKYKNNLLVSFKDPKFFPKDLPKLLKGIPALKDKILKNSFPTFKSNLEDCEFIFYTNSGIDEEIDCFREKAGLNETKPTTSIIQSELKEVFLKRLEKLALFATLEDEAKETSEENMVKNFQSVEMLGIVVELKDGKPRFINKKLAVYFAANWLSRHYKDKRDFLSGKFFEDNYKDLRKLFDLILAGSHDYHCSIVDDREVQEQGLSEISISPDRGERIPLHLAASYNNIKYAEKLLKVGNRSKQVKYRDSVLNWTPLQYALKTRSLGTLNHLLNVQKGEIVDNDCNILIEAIKENCLNLTANMMLHKDICEFKDESGNTPLHLAVWYGDISMVKQMVKTYKKKEGSGILSFNNKVPYVMNAPNKDENTPLHIAVIQDGNTPLILGVKVKNNEIVQELVENGADTSIKNNDGESALLLSVLSNSSEVVDVLLNFINKNAKSLEDINNSAHLAAEMGSKKILEKLTRSGAVLDAQNYAGDTKLHVAASHGEMEVVKLLVESGADLKLLNNKGNTPLQEAVEQNKIEVAKYLHENFPDRNFLYQAIVNGRKKMVDFLVNVGVNINSCNESGDLPLHVAIKNQRKDMAAYLIERGADLRAKDVNEDTALHVALSQGDIEMVQCVVNASNVNEPNAKGDSPLHLAVNKNRKDFVNCLIANDGDSSKQNLEGNSPIHEAVRKGLTEMVQHLITKGVNLNIRNKNGMTPLHVAVKEGRTEEAVLLLKNGANFKIRNLKGNSPLHEALHLNNFELTKELILNGVDIDTKNHDGNTALHELAKMGGESELELAELLFQRGAQLTLLNNNGNTPIIRAASRGREDFIKFFVDHGVDINEGPLGVTPLYVAVASGQFNVVKSLLEEYKADIEVCEEKTKQTPVHIAVRKNQLGILKYLVQRGARTDVYNRHSKTPLMLAYEIVIVMIRICI